MQETKTDYPYLYAVRQFHKYNREFISRLPKDKDPDLIERLRHADAEIIDGVSFAASIPIRNSVDTYTAYIDRIRCLEQVLGWFTVYPEKTDFSFCKERFVWSKRGFYKRLINPSIPGTEEHKLYAFRRFKEEGTITDAEITQQYKGVSGMIKSHPGTKKTCERLEKLYKETID